MSASNLCAGASPNAVTFIETFYPLSLTGSHGRSLRRKAWDYADPDFDGTISFDEADAWIRSRLRSEHTDGSGEIPYRNFRPTYAVAFHHAAGGDGAVSATEFCFFNAYLCVYAALYDAFVAVKAFGGGGKHQKEDDDGGADVASVSSSHGIGKGRGIRKEKFIAAYPTLTSERAGLEAFSTMAACDADVVFAAMDRNANGMISFKEWCMYLVSKEIDGGSEVGKLFGLRDNPNPRPQPNAKKEEEVNSKGSATTNNKPSKQCSKEEEAAAASYKKSQISSVVVAGASSSSEQYSAESSGDEGESSSVVVANKQQSKRHTVELQRTIGIGIGSPQQSSQQSQMGGFGFAVDLLAMSKPCQIVAFHNGTPAALAASRGELQLHDEIVGVNGFDASSWSIERIMDAVRNTPADGPLILAVMRHDQDQTTTTPPDDDETGETATMAIELGKDVVTAANSVDATNAATASAATNDDDWSSSPRSSSSSARRSAPSSSVAAAASAARSSGGPRPQPQPNSWRSGSGGTLGRQSSARKAMLIKRLSSLPIRVTASSPSEPSIDFLKDHPSTMTYSRRIALWLMKRKKWYNPHLGESEEVTIDKFAHRPKEEEENESDTYDWGEENGLGGEKTDTKFARVAPAGRVGAPTLHGGSTKTAEGAEENEEGPANESKEAQHQLPVPSLEKAWAYFEHDTLPRHIVKPKLDSEGRRPLPKKNCLVRAYRKFFKGYSKQLERAEPGEKYLPSKMYSPIFTPLNQMGDFGLGIGLYFATLRAIMILTFVAGLINIPNFIYFSGDSYSDGQDGVRGLLTGSAICTREVWVPCPTCGDNLDNFDKAEERLASVTVPADPNTGQEEATLYYAIKNDCDGATLEQGMVNYSTLFFIILGMLVIGWYQRKKEIEFDEDEQTAQDYSIIISNPPGDATDPYEWKDFFEQKFNARVTVITVGVDNDLLVQSLVERRETLKKLELLLPGEPLNILNLARISTKIERERKFFAWLFHLLMPITIGVPELVAKLTVLNAKIQGLAQQQYPSKQVFVTFETEADQRTVLSSMSVGPISAWKNDTSKVKHHHLFRGEKVLHVVEADEPSTVRWQDLNIGSIDRCKQLAVTFFVTLCAIALIAFIVKLCRDKDVLFSAIAIAVFNSAFPHFAKILTHLCESHASESAKQTSLYVKIAAFRWVITAIVITIITPFTSMVTNGKDHLISAVEKIIFADMITTTAIQLLDLVGFLKRHILGPRAKTQEAMNICFQGCRWELAERYTNMTKMLFLAVWYSSIFPGVFFLCSFAMLINFFADRFSLMRTWARAPQMGTRIAKISRKYFFTTAIIFMAIISAYSWSGFPFDNLCQVDNANIDSRYFQQQDVTTGDGKETFTIQIDENENKYKFCDQNMLMLGDFPPLSKFQPKGGEWMTEDQERLTDIYGWTAVTLLGGVCIFFAFGLVKWYLDLFRSTYEPTGEDQKINFSEVPSICAYVPQVQSTIFPYPLLAANVDYIDEEMFDWQDPDKPFSYYDLTKDAEELLSGISLFKDGSKNVFSKIRHFQLVTSN